MLSINNGRFRSPALVVALILVAAATRVTGQSSNEASSLSTAAADAPWPRVDLNVLVLNKKGTPQKVDEQQFRLFEDGAERPLAFPASPDSPVSLALVIDSSGSTVKRKSAMIAAATAIIKALPAESEVMEVAFSNEAFLDLPFTPVSKVDLSILNRVDSKGTTALNDALYAAETYFILHAKYARRALVILSDGQDNASRIDKRRLMRKLDEPGAPMVYLCQLSPANIFEQQRMVGHINLKFLAKWSGGIIFILDPDAQSTASQISAAIRSQHVLQFTARDPAHNGKSYKLQVRLPDKDMRIYGLPNYHAPEK